MVKLKRKQSRLGEVNFLGRPVSPIRNHKHSQPIFGFKPFKPMKPQPIKGYTGLNMFSSIAIPQKQSTSLWTPHMKPAGRAMWGDKDGDGVYNGFDCQPNNRLKQGKDHEFDKEFEKEQRQVDLYLEMHGHKLPWKEAEREAHNKKIMDKYERERERSIKEQERRAEMEQMRERREEARKEARKAHLEKMDILMEKRAEQKQAMEELRETAKERKNEKAVARIEKIQAERNTREADFREKQGKSANPSAQDLIDEVS